MKVVTSLKKTAAVLAVAVTVVSLTPMAANAAGKSIVNYRCYAQWWNTAFTGRCENAQIGLRLWVYADCNNQADKENGYYDIPRGFTGDFGGGECRSKVNSAHLNFN
ncbi:hypothetical protein [Sphaerisporangium aureirubrum]|uniref:Uncharacterized protein n=1 Tax=Sphaerisporangium aureirubrum TaxID=1544736 RepID=A0ABW1NKY0_9ACTN